jgi:hypothetical protein
MKTKLLFICQVLYILISTTVFGGNPDKKSVDPEVKAKAQKWIGAQQSTDFLENKGQMVDIDGKPMPFILFKTEAPGMNMFVTEQGLSYMFIKKEEQKKEPEGKKSSVNVKKLGLAQMAESVKIKYSRVDMNLPGAKIKRVNIITEGESSWLNNYYPDTNSQGMLNAHAYKKITVKEIYPGIDWVLYNSDSKGFKYDFIVHPGADPKRLKLVYKSEEDLNIDKAGNINIKTSLGTLTENTPICYTDKTKENIRAKFIKTISIPSPGKAQHESEITFDVDNYDKSKTLIIDPQLWWGTYIYDNNAGGASSTNPLTVDCDASGYVYVSGVCFGNLPLMPWGSAYFFGSMRQMFISRFTNAGVLTWSTYYGSSSNTSGPGPMTHDPAGNIYIIGQALAPMPVKSWGAAYYNPVFNPGGPIGLDGFITRFSNTGILQWATYYGGGGDDVVSSINIAVNGNIFITGLTSSTDFPVKTWGAAYYDNTINSTYDSYVAGFDNAGQLLWSSYLGGSLDDSGSSIVTDISGNIYVAGETSSSNFPIKALAGAYNDPSFNGGTNPFGAMGDITVTRFNNAGVLQWSTYLGGSQIDNGPTIGTDISNNIFVTGSTRSANFPTQTWGTAYFDGSLSSIQNVFITRFNSSCALSWSTYYGGSGTPNSAPPSDPDMAEKAFLDDIAFDSCGDLFFAFKTESPDITTHNPGCGSYYDNTYAGGIGHDADETPGDLFITKFSAKTGNLLWATYVGAVGNDNWGALAMDANNNLFIIGTFQYYTPATAAGLPFVNPGGGALFNNTPKNFTPSEGFILKFIPDPPPVLTQSQVNAGICVCNATATVSISTPCGIAPFDYVWSNGTQSLLNNSATNTASGLCPGSYWVEVKDDACHTDTVYYTIAGSPGNISATAVHTNVTCKGGSNGSATVSPTGGTSPYNYIWSSGQTTAGATGLTSGSYNVTIKDATGCTYQQVIVIAEPTLITTKVTGFTEAISCKPNAGSITVTSSGGVIPYTYTWPAPGSQTGQTATGLSQGIYTVTVKDGNGCIATQTVAVTLIPPPTFTLTATNGTCANGGSVTATANGGTVPYTYLWPAGTTISGAPETANQIPAGNNYTVTVTDANGCSGTKTFSITDTPNNVVNTYAQSPAGTICLGTPITFINTGTPPGPGVTYSWIIAAPANVSGTNADFSYTFLSAGTYSISRTVDDGTCNKFVSGSVTVVDCSAGPAITATTAEVCPGSCAIVTSSPAGGTGPYVYSWSTGATSQNINPCPASTTTYTVKITDAASATATTAVTVTVSPAIGVTAIPILNCATNSGSVTAMITGGSSSFTYSWSNGITTITGNVTSTISNLASNTYSVTVTDAKGCSTSSSAIIDPPFAAQYIKGTTNCIGCGCKEWIMVTPSNGRAPYTYIWPDGYDNRYQNKLCPGNYTIKITDKNGCSVNIVVNTP